MDKRKSIGIDNESQREGAWHGIIQQACLVLGCWDGLHEVTVNGLIGAKCTSGPSFVITAGLTLRVWGEA
jgi:hypothetical protein